MGLMSSREPLLVKINSASPTTLAAAIVGLGRWGRRLVDSVSVPPCAAIRFTHGVAHTPANAAEYLAQRGIAPASFEQVLANTAVQAVVLASPHTQHGAQVVAAARAGKHIFVEKPSRWKPRTRARRRRPAAWRALCWP